MYHRLTNYYLCINQRYCLWYKLNNAHTLFVALEYRSFLYNSVLWVAYIVGNFICIFNLIICCVYSHFYCYYVPCIKVFYYISCHFVWQLHLKNLNTFLIFSWQCECFHVYSWQRNIRVTCQTQPTSLDPNNMSTVRSVKLSFPSSLTDNTRIVC